MAKRSLLNAAYATSLLAAFAWAGKAAADTRIYTSKPMHLSYGFDYKGISFKFVSDLWLVIDRKDGGGTRVRLTGWGHLRQRNLAKKIWESTNLTLLDVSGSSKEISDQTRLELPGEFAITSKTTLSFAKGNAVFRLTLERDKEEILTLLSATIGGIPQDPVIAVPPSPPPVRSLQIIQFGSDKWTPVLSFPYQDWDGNHLTAEVRGNGFNIIRYGSLTWLPTDTIQIKRIEAGVEQNVQLQIDRADNKKFQYIVDGTTNWITGVKGFEFKSWGLEGEKFHDGRTTVEMTD